ncbi:MAG TPA: alkaline phosphatase family protein [Planktothrix sp.]|jgi:phospholipase C
MKAILPLRSGSDPIKHVVLIMFENHSFTEILGDLTKIYPGLKGIDQKNPKFNEDLTGRRYYQQPATTSAMITDPNHEMSDTAVQMAFGRMDGFVKDYQFFHPQATAEQLQAIMNYYPLGSLPADHTFAQHFTFFDQFHASVPGPTFPNRFFHMQGTSGGLVNMPQSVPKLNDLAGWAQVEAWLEMSEETLFDRLTEAGVNYRCYFNDVPISLMLKNQRQLKHAARYFDIEQFYKDAAGPAADFPEFAYIEPSYIGANSSDEHPPGDIMNGQKLKVDLYNAIFANEELANSTLFIVTYDEHGGFYDDVYPPQAVPPDRSNKEYAFNQLGLRVPTYLISPWVERGFDSGLYDHTSVLKYLQEKFGLGSLGDRTAAAASFAHLIGQRQTPRSDFPRHIDMPQPKAVELTDADEGRINNLASSVSHLSTSIEQELRRNWPVRGRLTVWFERLYRWYLRRREANPVKALLVDFSARSRLIRRFADKARNTPLAKRK